MVVEVGNIIIEKIETLPFVDVIAGVVKTISWKTDAGVLKKEPGACTTTEEECRRGDYISLLPDNSKKSVIFLEDKGIRFMGREAGNQYKFRASYDLICWLNLPALGFSDCSYSAIAIMAILSALPASPISSSGVYSRLNFIPVGQAPKNQNPYQKYTIEETKSQFLMYPYDSFILNIDVEFFVNKSCLTAQALNPPIPCK